MDKRLYNIFSNIGIDLELVDISQTTLVSVCDSLQYMSLVCDIEDEFGIVMSEELLVFDENKTIKSFIEEVKELL